VNVNAPEWKVLCALVVLFSASACTTAPSDRGSFHNNDGEAANAVDEKTASRVRKVVDSPVGVPLFHTDQPGGQQLELLVGTEYFSANGRICRRYAESNTVTGATRNGLVCNDPLRGWIEIPLESFAG